jgi:hypothetical protein
MAYNASSLTLAYSSASLYPVCIEKVGSRELSKTGQVFYIV